MQFEARKLGHVLASANLLAWSFPALTADPKNKVNSLRVVYPMAKIDDTLMDIRVHGRIGLRHEETRQHTDSLDRKIVATINGRQQTTATTFATSTHETSYSNNLPSLLLAADLTRKLVARYGYYTTFLRPDARANLPVSTQVSQDALAGCYTVNLGRGGIKPYTSDFAQQVPPRQLRRTHRPGNLAVFIPI